MERNITNLGKFLEKHRYTKRAFSKESGVNESTVLDLCNKTNRFPRYQTIRRVMEVVRRIEPKAKASDFFDIKVPYAPGSVAAKCSKVRKGSFRKRTFLSS